METKYKVIIAVAVVGIAFAIGRYTVPEKVRVETHTVYVQVDHSTTDTNSHSVTHTHTNTDGSSDSTTTIDSGSHTNHDSTTNQASTTINEVTRGDSKMTISALGGIPIGDWQPVFGASVTKPVFGPISVGAWGLSNKTVGVSIGLTF